MNDAQKIEEGAIINARADYEALNEWLEKQKKRIHDFEIDKPHLVYAGLSLFSLGVFVGSKSSTKFRWLVSFLSGAGFSYSTLMMFLQLRREKQIKENPDEPKEAKDPADPKADPSGHRKELKNIKIIHD